MIPVAIKAFFAANWISVAGVVLAVVGFLGAQHNAFNRGEAACEARHETARKALQRDIDGDAAVWAELSRSLDVKTAANEKGLDDAAAKAHEAIDASAAVCAGPDSMRRLRAIK